VASGWVARCGESAHVCLYGCLCSTVCLLVCKGQSAVDWAKNTGNKHVLAALECVLVFRFCFSLDTSRQSPCIGNHTYPTLNTLNTQSRAQHTQPVNALQHTQHTQYSTLSKLSMHSTSSTGCLVLCTHFFVPCLFVSLFVW